MNYQKRNKLYFGISVALLLGGVSAGALSQSPYSMPNHAMITINGTVDKIYRDSFTLDYDNDAGEGIITVEMDDGDRDADAYVLRHGDEVTVTGRIDADFYEATTIEAGTVFVDTLDTHFYSSALDEEDYYLPMYYPADLSMETLQGRVTDVGVEDFTLSTGTDKIIIEVDEMLTNPLDDVGYPQVDENDIVSVRGHVDYDLFENHTFEADGISIILNTGS